MLQVQLLGPLIVRDEAGRDLTPPGGRERNGLATLAVVSPDSVSTERLAGELYRERHTADPRNAVQAMVSRLRRALGRAAGSVETTANGYRLVDVALDIDEAERLLRDAMADDDPRRAGEALDQARALWHGPTLDGLDGGLIETERLRIDGLRCDAEDAVLQRRVSAEAGMGPDQNLVADLEAATRAEPLREKRWELLMLVLYRAGRQADALRAFQRARTVLGEHLGLEPGPGLTELERRILAHDPGLAPPADGPVAPPGASGGQAAGPAAGSTSTSTPATGEAAAATPLPGGTLSVLLCDVVGSVRRWEADPGDTATEIERLHRLWRRAVDGEGGLVVKSTGDGILAVFETADRAVRAAATAMAEQGRLGLEVKAAIHSGALEPTGNDYRGPVVNRCARLVDLAAGGQILVTGPTAELARGPLAGDGGGAEAPAGTGADPGPIGLRDLGAHWLRDVAEPMPVWQVTGPGLRASFPPLPSRDPSSLPRLRGRLLGRDALVERITGLVGEEPLVTLLGPGGIGKTSASLAVAWNAVGWRPVTFVDLARVEDPAAVGDRLAEAVTTGHDEDGDRTPADRIADRLVTGTDLVVIDNAEHVLDAVAAVVEDVLTHQLKGSFLVTSRQPLGLADEVIVGVPPLEVPDDGDDLAATGRAPSVELFIDRARAGQPDFRLADGLLPVVAHICRRLDGIPLAIELAAGRAALLSVDDIAARLDDQLRLLRQVRSQREQRHRSLEAVVQWSVDQLSPEGREVFDRASAMAGSFGLDGLEALLEGCGVGSVDALEALDELNGASLLSVEPGGSRFRMLEPIRQFAAAELAERGLEVETRRAHAEWVTALVADAHGRRDRSRRAARARVDAEADQVLAALTWVADAGQADLAGGLAYPTGFWFLTGDARLGERLLRRLVDTVDRDADPLGWANAVLGLGVATATHPRSEVGRQSLDAIAIFDEHRHPERGLARLAAAFAQTGGSDLELPLRLLGEAERLTSSDDRFAHALIDLAITALTSVVVVVDPDAVDPAEPIERGRRAIAVFQELDETWALGTALAEQGRLHQRLGDLEAAERCYLESIDLLERDDAHSIHYVLTELGRMASDRGHHERADRYHREAMRVAELDGNDGCLALSLAGQAYSAEARGAIDGAIDLYRLALELVEDTILEAGWTEWREALERLEASRR
jgi:predicted ATPase/class 3 adenylate cyclase